MQRKLAILLVVLALPLVVLGQGLGGEPVFHVQLLPDRQPLVAGEPYHLAVKLEVDSGWHVNTDRPGSDFSVPTTLEWKLPEGWTTPAVTFPEGRSITFDFSDTPIHVWEGTVVLVAEGTVPPGATGTVPLQVTVTAQACNNTSCLPPTPVTAGIRVEVAPAGSASRPVNQAAFGGGEKTGPAAKAETPAAGTSQGGGGARGAGRLAGASLPLQLLIVFLAGLALNLTPCVYPLIPITVGFFANQAKDRRGGTFGLAVVYVLGMSVTYSALGVAAALTGQIFGAALQSPVVILVIVAVLIALALSMFGLWEIRVPGWAMRASGGKGGLFGALIMGLLVGFVAAPCIGPFVLGLLTYVGQVGSPYLGFILFFSLAMGLGLPYLILGTFTGAVNKIPASGAWMIGVRKVFGVLLLALAVYFLKPILPGAAGAWAMAAVLLLGGFYMLVVERTGHEQPAIDRVMRLLAAAMMIAGVLYLPLHGRAAHGEELDWQRFEEHAVHGAVSSGRPVIVDFFADWCAPCRELDEKTFSDPRVARELGAFERFKVDMTRATAANRKLASAYGVRGVPTVIVYRDGTELFRITGFEPPERFLERLKGAGH